jgi:flagellar protein FliS
MNNKYYQAYNNNAVLTANRGELTLMLYNGALKFCKQALETIESNDVVSTHNALIKAQNIIEELQITLDNRYPVSESIDKLYTYILDLLAEANAGKDKDKLNEAIYFITEFRDLWKQVMAKQGKEASHV